MTEKEFLKDFNSRDDYEQFYWFDWNMGPWQPITVRRIIYRSEKGAHFSSAVFQIHPGGDLVTFEQIQTYGKLGDFIERPKVENGL